MRVNEKMKKLLSILLCLCMLVQNAPVMAFAATTDNLCEHHAAHTAECGYAEAVAGSDCTHSHDGSCGYAEPVAEVLCTCEATDENGALVHTEGCGYVAPVTGADCTHNHDEHCGYAAPVEAKPCTYHCDICLGHDHDEEEQETTAPSSEATEPSSEATEPDPVCNCGTDDPAIHATTCAVYVAPETPQCFCVEKCTEVNEWCDVCGFDISKCGGTDMGVPYADAVEITGVTITVDNVPYNSGNVTIYSNSAVTLTVTGTNLQYATDVCYVIFSAGVGVRLNSGYFAFNGDGTIATMTVNGSSFHNSDSHEITYCTDYTTVQTWVNTGIFLTYSAESKTVSYGITVSASENGTVTADPTTAAEGETVTLTVKPAEGYVLDTLTVKQGETDVTVTDNTFIMPAGDVTVSATFKACTHETFAAGICTTCGAVCEHSSYDNGFCTVCDAYQSAALNGRYYEIYNAGQLYWFADKVNSGENNIDGKLMENIVVNEGVMTAESTDARVWTPIGNNATPYTGAFSGNSKTISGLYVPGSEYAGFIGYKQGLDVSYLGIINSYICGTVYAGGVVGSVSQSPIWYCYNTGTVTGTGHVGGVVGKTTGNILNCYNTGTVTGTGTNGAAGGVVGFNDGSGCTDCYNTGTVSGDGKVGGVVGENSESFGKVYRCYYLTGTAAGGINGADVEGQAEARTAEQFASGEVAYLLGEAFGQTIGSDASPVLGGPKVYYGYTDCEADAQPVYTNNEKASEAPGHTGGVATCNGYQCEKCGEYYGEPAAHNWDATGYCPDCKAQAQAKIGDIYYLTLAEAAEEVNQGGTIQVLTDVTIGAEETLAFGAFAELEVAEDKTITCDGTVTIGEEKGIIFQNELYYLGELCANGYIGINLNTATPNTYYPAGDGYAIYEGDGTLRLHNAVITTPDPVAGSNLTYAIYSGDNLTIYFSGNNYLTSGNTDETNAGIYVKGDLTLTAVGENAELTARSGNSGGGNAGIEAKSLTVNGGTVTAIGGDADKSLVDGIQVETNLTVNSGTVYARGGSSLDSFGVVAGFGTGSITVAEGAALYATGGQGTMSAGVMAGTVSGNVNALGISQSGTDTAAALDYTVYGDLVMDKNVTISNPYAGTEAEDQVTVTFTVPEGTSLTVNENVTLDLSALDAKKIEFLGTVINNGTILLPEGFSWDSVPQGGTITIGNITRTWNGENWICGEDSHVTKTAENKATCEKKAVCDICGEEYGELAAHSFGTSDTCTYGCGTRAKARVYDAHNGNANYYYAMLPEALTAAKELASDGVADFYGVYVFPLADYDGDFTIPAGLIDFNGGSYTFFGAVTNNGNIYGGTFNGTVTSNAKSQIHGGTFNGTVTNNTGGMIFGGTFNGDVINYGTVNNITSGKMELGEDFSIENHGSIDCQHHFWKDGACRLCAEPCEHTSTCDNAATCLKIAKCDTCGIEYGEPLAHEMNSTDGKCIHGCGKLMAVASTTVGTTTYYETLDAAIQAVKDCTAEDKATVRLEQSINLGASYQKVTGGVFTLDLNSHSLTGGDYGLHISGSTTHVTITDSGTGGTVSGTNKSRYGVYVNNSTVELTGGTVSGDRAVYVNDSTVEISGGTVSGDRAVYVNDSTVEITGGKISGSTYGVYVSYSTATISGGEISGGNYDLIRTGDSTIITLTLADGKTEGAVFNDGITVDSAPLAGILGEGLAYWQKGKQVTLTDGQLEITGGDVTVKAVCDHTGNTNKPTDAGNGQHSVTCSVCKNTVTGDHTGGEATCTEKAICEACGESYGELGGHTAEPTYAPNAEDGSQHIAYYPCCDAAGNPEDHTFDPTTGKCVCGFDIVASVTNGDSTSYFLTLQGAIDAAEVLTDSTVTVLDDVILTQGLTVEDGTFTLDLNGKTVSAAADTLIVNGGNVTIKTSVAGGTLSMTGNKDYALRINGAVTLENGAVSSEYLGIIVDGGSFTMNDGEVTSKKTGIATVSNGTAVILRGKVLSEESNSVHNNGGNITLGDANGGPTIDAPNGVGVNVNHPVHIYNANITANTYGIEFNSSAELNLYGSPTIESGTADLCVGYGSLYICTDLGSAAYTVKSNKLGNFAQAVDPVTANTAWFVPVDAGHGVTKYGNNLNLELIGYTVTYDLDGGSLPQGVSNYTIYYVTTDTFTLNHPTKVGYLFTGWTGTELDAAAMEVTITKGSTGDRSYTANWQECAHPEDKLSYESNGDNHTWTCAECSATGTEAHTLTYTANGNVIAASCYKCKADLGTATITAENATYNGTEQMTATVAYSEGWKGGELTVSYANNVNAGTATASITLGEGENATTASVDFTITAASLADAKITVASDITYTGSAIEPAVTVKLGDKTLNAADYVVAYSSNTNVGTATVTITGKGNYKDSASTTFTIAQAAAPAIQWPTASGLTYGQKLSDSTLTSEDENGTFAWQDSNTVPTVTNSGYVVVYTPNDTDNYDYSGVELTKTISVTVRKAAATVATAPTEKDLTYTGSVLDLINAGSANGGTMQYSIDNQTWSTTIPQGTDAGEYTVYYKVVGDSNHNDTDVQSVKVKIGQLAVAEPTVTGTNTYTGSEQTVTLTGVESCMTIASGNKGTNAGSYEVVITLDGNHKWADGSDGKVQWSIAKAEPKAEDFVFQAPGNLTYDGEAKSASISVKTGIEGMGEIFAVMYYNAESRVARQPVSAGNYFVQINVAEGENYTEKTFWGGDDWVFTIGKAKAEITVDTTPITVTYGETVTLPAATANFGNVSCDKTADDLVNAGTYTVTYTVAGTANYDGDTKTVTVTVNPKAITEADVKLNGSLTYTGEELTQPVRVADGITYTVTGDKATNVGTYELIVQGIDNYTGEVKLSWSIKEAAAVVEKAPAAKTLTYTGEAQELITAGEAKGGTMQYQLNGGAWSTTIPTATDEGSYTVSYKVVGDANHADTDPVTLTVTIGDCTHSGNTNKDDTDCTTAVACSVCGDVLVAAKAHVWGDWTTTKEPTTTAEGSKERPCTNDGCEVKDTDSIPMLNEVEAPKPEGGDIDIDNPTPATGEDVTITVTPEPGKEVEDITVTDKDGNEIPVTDNGDGTYTYEQPDGDVTVEVTMKDSEYEVEIQQPDGGKVETDNENPNMGDKVTVTVTPEPGKKVEDITVTDKDGNEIPVTDNGDGTYTYEQPAGDVDIEVTMKDSEYEVEIQQPDGGEVKTDNDSPIMGDDVTITVTPDTGKEVDEVIVTDKDGKEIPVTDNGDGTYTYEQPADDVTVEVIVKDTIYTVTWIVDGTTYKTTQYKYGETITAPADPTKAQSGCTTYTFDKWNGFTSGMTMPDDPSLTFAAVFTEGESHIDENTDHICDRNCGKTDMGDHVDENRDHVCDYGCETPIGDHSDVTTDQDHKCDYCGEAMPKDGTQVEIPTDDTGTIVPGAPAEIDGKPIVIDWDGEIWLEDKGSKFLVTYQFNEDADPHKEYPTAMYAWLLKWEGENCKAIRVPELDNFMTYKGTSIRINHSSDGIRFFTAVPVDALNQAMKGTLLTGELEGYKLVELGTLYKWAATGTELTVANGAKSYVYGGSAGSTYRQFSKEGSLSWFTGMLTELPGDAATLAKDILSRPYAVFENADGDQITLYGGSIQRSIYYVALQNKDTWASGTAYDNYVEKIISTVEAAKG